MNQTQPIAEKLSFTPYQKLVVAILALLQFTIILDFMVLSPLGTILIKELSITPARFGWVVSAYAFSAGISGVLAAGFADKYDRKKLLLIFYTGFLIGTALCAMATDFHSLLIARIVTGLFAGVVGSASMAIVTDLFPIQMRGRVMGYIQMAFGGSQVLGIPIGLLLATRWGWHSTFWMIVVFGLLLGFVILYYMKPVTEHLKLRSEKNPLEHLVHTITMRPYLLGFLGTMLLATGGFMIMPFASTFTTNNLGIHQDQLPQLYLITGISSLVLMPLIGRASDKIDKYLIFCVGTALSMLMIGIYTNMGHTTFAMLLVVNIIMFTGIMSRMIPAGAITSAIPQPQDRGAFMSINSSVQQVSGGIAAAISGMIIVENPDKSLRHFDTVGYVTMIAMVVAAVIMYFVARQVQHKMGRPLSAKPAGEAMAT
ncbi:MFS transporter [Paraflavitalea sp. CAU 1676]|uniref:MFS transporter n=1 Tax=Paraflavitalea sp. CAU 1676 TaxID=3032598 RepID=UPI0023DBF615|nr:MFS transporter [Paraflavitalea sp. CAU 1676]MDF2190099.1 MFS transporter [Paraflavitalea sp. CAU 1676]